MATPNQNFYPTCRFCGAQTLPTAQYDSQTQADESATLACKCVGAEEYQTITRQKAERENNIIKLTQRLDDFTSYCAHRGAELEGALYDFLKNVGITVLDNDITAANVKFGRMKVTISKNNKDNIVISFTYSDGAKVEV